LLIIPVTSNVQQSNGQPSSTRNIRVGPAGWSYRDWAGKVYPRKRPASFSEVGYIAQFFDVAEINTSFYGTVKQSTVEKWLRSVEHNPRFQFTAKLHQVFTHQMNPSDSDERDFRIFADTLMSDANGRLGALLAQFPWSFKNTEENRAYLDALLERFKEYPMVVEARHSSWDDRAFWELLAERGAGFCNIDQPVIGRSLKPTARTASRVAYVRLHGRNYKEWFARTPGPAGAAARYDYLYTKEELEEWKERVEQVAENALPTYVITNNHYEGKGAANALELISMLDGIPPAAPATLVEAYPRLAESTRAVSAEPLPPLFV
jgi:uncharacterized protein YecE (DUF72 family)